MNIRLILLCLCCFVGFVSSKGEERGSRLLMTGCGFDRLVMVDTRNDSVVWSHALRSNDDCNDIEVTRENHILFAYKYGARMIDWNERLIWDYRVKEGEELYTATQRPDGGYDLFICGKPDRWVVLNNKGEATNELAFHVGGENIHGHFRQITPTQQGTYLIPSMSESRVVEMNTRGEFLRSVKVDGNPFSVKVLDNGQWLVSCGDGHCWNLVDPVKGEVVERSAQTVDGVNLLFVSEILPLGHHKVVTNWNGHSKDKTQPSVFEVDKNNNVVWKLSPRTGIEKISAIYKVD